MSTNELRKIEKAPDQGLALLKMLAADHAAGRHDKLPLTKCEACRTDPDFLRKRDEARQPAIDEAADKAEKVWTRPLPTGMPPVVKAPKRSTKTPVSPAVEPQFVWNAPVVEVPDDTTMVLVHPSGVTADGLIMERPVKSKDMPKIIPGPVFATQHATRESWLLAGVAAMTPWIEAAGSTMPPVRVSIGWPGGRGKKTGVRGQCWMASTVADGQPAIFITPDQHEPETILAILLHEMDHAVGNGGHRGAFAKLAGMLGLVKPWITATPNPDLKLKIAALAEKLGPFPHARVNAGHGLLGAGPTRPPVQSTRMILLRCPVDGYSVRTTRKWIEVGLPFCPQGEAERAVGPEEAFENTIKHLMHEVTK